MVPYGHQDKSLAKWVSNQRRYYKTGDVKQERVDLLEELCFVWKIDKADYGASLSQREWDSMFGLLEEYKKEFD